MIICFIFGLNCSCDADPSALAKYVVALVKKDKTEKELKALCIDQLDVFLQKGKRNPSFKENCILQRRPLVLTFKVHLQFANSLPETQPFVDELFEAILNKTYMPQTELPSSVAKMEKDEQKKDEVTF